MPEVKFYISDEERKELFDYVRENEGEFIPKLIYPEPKYEAITDRDDFIDCIYNKVVGFFILSPRYQVEPMGISELTPGNYSIYAKQGGPAIMIHFYRGFAEDASILYKSTIMYHYPRYIDYGWVRNKYETYMDYPVPDELKEYYKMINKFLRSKCKRIVGRNGKKYWVSKKVLEEEDVLGEKHD